MAYTAKKRRLLLKPAVCFVKTEEYNKRRKRNVFNLLPLFHPPCAEIIQQQSKPLNAPLHGHRVAHSSLSELRKLLLNLSRFPYSTLLQIPAHLYSDAMFEDPSAVLA
jgi:hypothetical protein